jgi:hypothetical protein
MLFFNLLKDIEFSSKHVLDIHLFLYYCVNVNIILYCF